MDVRDIAFWVVALGVSRTILLPIASIIFRPENLVVPRGRWWLHLHSMKGLSATDGSNVDRTKAYTGWILD